MVAQYFSDRLWSVRPFISASACDGGSLMTTLPFTKMQGSGNDFMVVDATVNSFLLTPAQIQAAADRHLGVGFDQLLVVAPPTGDEADFTYLIYNSDGSSAQQCGNGARCLARFIQSRGLSSKKKLRLQTGDKITVVSLEPDDSVTVEIPEPSFEPEKIPFKSQQEKPPYQLTVCGEKLEFYVAGVGNPHAVILADPIDPSKRADIGAALSIHPDFPEGVNVGFMQIINPGHIRLEVCERGAGFTLACGSGACAAVAVGFYGGLLNKKVCVTQRGGDLWIHWEGTGSAILMRGPAQFVYAGSLFLPLS